MCGRFTIRIPATVLMHQFGVEAGLQLPLRFNVAPTQQIPVITQQDDTRQLEMMKWGLVPSWADDPKIGYRMINARSEEAAAKLSFRSAMKKRRCVTLADGFYEWEKVGNLPTNLIGRSMPCQNFTIGRSCSRLRLLQAS